MIAICELQCKVFSHEKVNSGFIYGLRLAYPHEPIRFYGDPSHIEALRKILAHDQVVVDNIEYVPVHFPTKAGLVRAIVHYRLLGRIFRDIVARAADKIFFLSFNAEILFAIKRLKRQRRFRPLKFTLVLHGAFETIAREDDAAQAQAPPPRQIPAGGKTLLERLRHARLSEVPGKAVRLLARKLDPMLSVWGRLSNRYLPEKKLLLWRHSGDFRYICLSPHVRVNAGRYVDVDALNFHTVVLPTVFAPPAPAPHNPYPKFAMFGYGNSAMLHQLLLRLEQLRITRPYEVRIIGMDNRGIEGFANVTCPSRGKPLDRQDMEAQARDIDMFMILYDKSRYRLSCSGSILESLSYLKPVLHLQNECLDHFNRDALPIGIRSGDLDELAARMQDIIENPERYGPQLEMFRNNMLQVRQACCIEQSVAALRASFSW